MRKSVLVLAVACLFAGTAVGQFAPNKGRTKFTIQRAGAVKLGPKVKITVQSAGREADAAALRTKLTTMLGPKGITVADDAPQEISVTINKLDATIDEKPVTQMLLVKSTRTVMGHSVPSCEMKAVSVREKEFRGSGELVFQVRDPKTGVALFSRTATPAFNLNGVDPNSVSDACPGKNTGLPAGTPKTEGEVRRKMMDDVLAEVLSDLVGSSDEREVTLATPDELMPGNKLAEAGDLNGALESWAKAQPNKTKKLLPYRDYNMAVGNLILALQATDPQDAGKRIETAQQLYNNAVAGAPQEAGFAALGADLKDAKETIDKRITTLEEQQRETSQLVNEAQSRQRWLKQPLDPNWFPEDESQELKRFRTAVRERFGDLPDGQQPGAAQLDELGRYAVRLDIGPKDKNRIINDESARLTALRQALSDYANTLKSVLKGRSNVTLTAQERKRLNDEIEVLHLTADLVQPVENNMGIKSKK